MMFSAVKQIKKDAYKRIHLLMKSSKNEVKLSSLKKYSIKIKS